MNSVPDVHRSDDPVLQGRMPIFVDIASIVSAYLRAHSEVKFATGYPNRSTGGPLFWVSDTSKCTEGYECTIERDDERWSYYGIEVGIVRWMDKPGGYHP